MELYTMLDKYSTETIVSNYLHDFLVKEQYEILQLITPGSQATYSLAYTHPITGKKKVVFPDVIALSKFNIILGEIKSNFSSSDKSKLLSIKNSIDGEEKIKFLVKRVLNIEVYDLTILYYLIHADTGSQVDGEISQLIFDNGIFNFM